MNVYSYYVSNWLKSSNRGVVRAHPASQTKRDAIGLRYLPALTLMLWFPSKKLLHFPQSFFLPSTMNLNHWILFLPHTFISTKQTPLRYYVTVSSSMQGWLVIGQGYTCDIFLGCGTNSTKLSASPKNSQSATSSSFCTAYWQRSFYFLAGKVTIATSMSYFLALIITNLSYGQFFNPRPHLTRHLVSLLV